jgi:fibronectin type 3 domain-containing protein
VKTLFTLFAALFFLGGLAACGKRRPPLPPVERIPQRTELLSGAQRGNQVVLSWPAPLRNASDGSVQSIRRIDIYRLAEKPDAPLPLTEEDYSQRAAVIGSIQFAEIKAAGETLTYTDVLTFTGNPTRLRYALKYVNSAGQKASFSNFLIIEPAGKIALPPRISAVGESENALSVKWQAPAGNIDGSDGLNIIGYNIYRATGDTTLRNEPLNGPNPVNATEFSDTTFNFGEQYTYIVRAVSVGANGQPVESLNSNAVAIKPIDKYPPTAPTNLSLAVSPNGKTISLFFPANPERDIAGYRLYRATDSLLPLNQWQPLTSGLLTRTTFRDETVAPGRSYSYYLIAVDAAGNTSQPSAVVTETIPQ